MQGTIQHYLQRLFAVYPGEGKRAWRFVVLGFLWNVGISSGLTLSDALFLLHVGSASLPIAYTITSLGMLAIGTILLYASHRLRPTRYHLGILLTCALHFVLAGGCLYVFDDRLPDAFFLALKIISYMFYLMIITSYWNFVDQFYDLQDAKRLYALFYSATFVGFFSGGALIGMSILSVHELLIFSGSVMLLTAWWVTGITRKTEIVHDELQEERPSKAGQAIVHLLRSVASSPFTMLLLLCNLSLQVLFVITDFNMRAAFEDYFSQQIGWITPDEADANLTIFLGQLTAWTSVGGFLFGLLLFSRMVRYLGTANTIPIPALMYLFIYINWGFSAGLISGVLAYFITEGLIDTTEDNTYSLMLNAVPGRIKQQTRVIVDSFFEPIGMLIASIVLAVASDQSKFLGFGLSVAAVLVGLALRSQYFQGIIRNLRENALDFHRPTADWLRKQPKSSQKALLRRLEDERDEHLQLLAAEALLNTNPGKHLRKVLLASRTFSTASIQRLLRMLKTSGQAEADLVQAQLEQWAAVPELLPHVRLMQQTEVEPPLDSESPTGEAEVFARIVALRSVPAEQAAQELLPLFRHKSPLVAQVAAEALEEAVTSDCAWIMSTLVEVIQRTPLGRVRRACLRALGSLDSPEAVEHLVAVGPQLRAGERYLIEELLELRPNEVLLSSLLANPALSVRSRLICGRVLGRINRQRLSEILSDLVQDELHLGFWFFLHRHTIQDHFPDLDLALLADALDSSYHAQLDFVIQLLSIAGSAEDPELISHFLRSRNPKVHSQAVEILERSCEPKLFRLLLPLVDDDMPLDQRLNYCRNAVQDEGDLEVVLARLQRAPSLMQQIIAFHYRSSLNSRGWRADLRRQLGDAPEILQHFAEDLLPDEHP